MACGKRMIFSLLLVLVFGNCILMIYNTHFDTNPRYLRNIEYNLSQCPNFLALPEVSVVDRWQTVYEDHLYVYSAYIDERHKLEIKVVAITRGTLGNVYCQLWYEHTQSPVIVPASTHKRKEQQFLKKDDYFATIVSCEVKDLTLLDHYQPSSVSIMTSAFVARDVRVRIHHNKPPDYHTNHQFKYNFTVCLGGPLKLEIGNTNHLTEWIEMNHIFGADHFILYNHSASPLLLPYIEYYRDEAKLVEWLPWQLPNSILNPIKTMKNFGHMGLIYDCLYRSAYVSRYVVYLDTDEFLVPRLQGVHTWNELIDQKGCREKACISVQNVFFKKEWANDKLLAPDDDAVTFELLTQIKSKKEKKVWLHRIRSKYITKPDQITDPGVHFCDPANSKKQCLLTPKEALIHHYRNWQNPNTTGVVDRYMQQFRVVLIDRVTLVHQKVKEFTKAFN